ncbi:hypothetical protein A3J56_02605 [Candidatus Giovannonibacteria bacterium RIFCSPHIGHO2_02_FULL_46_20]|uniref:Uncharacterized protein n=1 Tax=Candidatus Giovannonibacteria bacterium RIFCSPHIGHO2_02_FULL_46_20 TaxID=1798338 RepID=A0A1F5WGR3_9BACT|nr:MAG: hypothetical protein A3J56_02605 [Candidatus Giovannonibacteria bacterium RIFCSPHIGHO2_02_FULL_46_20]
MQLQVANWRYPRHAFFEGNTLKMEVARVVCQHCSTCSRRVETVESQLKGTNVAWRWETANGGLYLAVELPDGAGETHARLGSLLGLPIRST